MKFRRLFSLEIEHGFQPSGGFRGARIDPRADHPSGNRMLARHRLLLRRRAAGIEVATPVDDDDQPLIGFADDLGLGFELRATDPDFALFTDLSAWAGLERPILQSVEGQAALQLADEAPGAPRPHDVMALIEITGISASWLADPPKFTIELANRSLYFVYYLVTHRTGTPSIVNPEVPAFTLTELTAEQARADLAVQAVFDKHADSTDPRCFRWISSQPIPRTAEPLRNLELRLAIDENPLNDEILFAELPTPPLRHRLAPLNPGDAESLFHVVEY